MNYNVKVSSKWQLMLYYPINILKIIYKHFENNKLEQKIIIKFDKLKYINNIIMKDEIRDVYPIIK